ncbi:MAG TPA: cytochrome o ubiquinol oxidase subunit III [Candidatus Saccharimonadales bacterium]|nr:cytochrome o ubiquinol oxidase subunit III [Candidatus Saccharimonadales bacterium]
MSKTAENAAVAPAAASLAAEAAIPEYERNPAAKTLFGFWVYLMTDCILFATLFATFAVLRGNTNGGVSGHDIFSLPYVLAETLILLTSSFSCGLAILSARQGNRNAALAFFGATFLLGASFLGLELHEFIGLAHDGNSWRQSGFLSSFFTLVGTHGLHITAGLIWMLVMMIRTLKQGLTENGLRRLTLLSMFWHFLDVVWIFIFTIVYLLGVL